MDKDNIKNVILLLDNNEKPKYVYIFREDAPPTREYYNKSHEDLLRELMNKNSVSSLKDLVNLGIVKGITSTDSENIQKLDDDFRRESESFTINNSTDNNNLDSESEIKKDPSNKKKIVKGVVATTAAVAAIAGGAVACTRQEEKKEEKTIDFNTASFEELMNSMSESSERRIFSENVYNTMETLNKKMLDENVFYMSVDGEAVLQFTSDEIIAAKLAFNTYSDEQLKEIFGMEELNADVLLTNYQSFASKMKAFAMSGKQSSTISNLIEDSENREWFEAVENSITAFNSNLSNENADKVIRTFAYFYSHGINGIDNLENDKSSINCIKNLALNMVVGYSDANANTDYKKYLVVSSEPSEFDSKYVTNKLSQVQKGEKLLQYIEIANKGVCTTASVKTHFENAVSQLSELQNNQKNIATQALATVLLDEKQSELGNKVLYDVVNDTLKEEINKTGNKKCIEALETYNNAIEGISKDTPTFAQIKVAINSELGPYKDINTKQLYTSEELENYLITIVNNRHRGVELTNSNRSPEADISREEFNSMSKKEQKEFIKENGEVVSTKKTTTSKEVSKNDLTPSEKKEAEKQEEELKNIVVVEGNEYKADTAKAALDGQKDANDYSTSTNLDDRVFRAYFEGKTVNYDTYINESIPAMNAAMAKHGYKDESEKTAYKNTWKSEIKDRVDHAIKFAKEGHIPDSDKGKEEVKKKELEEIEKLNKQEQNNSSNEENNNNISNDKDNNSNNNNNNTPVEEVPIASETPSEDNLLDDPNINTTPPESDAEIIGNDTVSTSSIIEVNDVPISYQTSVSEPANDGYEYNEDEIIAASIEGFEEAYKTYKKVR